jgi:methionyl-tRNA formyltransferase
MALRLVFMGTPAFAVPALESLIAAGHQLASVYCQPPRKAGRGGGTRTTAVEDAARRHGIDVRAPASLKSAEVQNEFAALGCDAAVVAAYGSILPRAILEVPRLGCLNIHASLLPRWRGAAPIARAIEVGDAETGVTIMAMDEGLDTGGVLLQEHTPIGPKTTAGELTGTLAQIGARLVLEALAGLNDGTLIPRPQPSSGVTYAAKIAAPEERLDFRGGAVALERKIRAFSPDPGTWFEFESERVRVLAADAKGDSHKAPPGTVLDGRLLIACGRGALRPITVQRAGSKAMPVDDFLRGRKIPAGTVLKSPD